MNVRRWTVPVFSERGGMGIGLAVSRAIVEAHGGRLELDDVTDGTTVAVHLPNRALDAGSIDWGYEPRRSLRISG